MSAQSEKKDGMMNGHCGRDGPSDSHTESTGNQYCCLNENGRPCNRPASNASYSKRIQGTVAQRKLKLQLDPKSQHMYICEYHKSIIQTSRMNIMNTQDM